MTRVDALYICQLFMRHPSDKPLDAVEVEAFRIATEALRLQTCMRDIEEVDRRLEATPSTRE